MEISRNGKSLVILCYCEPGCALVKLIENLAQTTVAAAFAGGVILVNADNAVIRHDGNYINNVGNVLEWN